MAEIAAQSLLKTPTVEIRDVYCEGRCRHRPEQHTSRISTVLVVSSVWKVMSDMTIGAWPPLIQSSRAGG